MVFFRWMGFTAGLLAGFAASAQASGISVRFLACPPEDSIVRYEIRRSEAVTGAESLLGQALAVPGKDTLEFQDKGAEKGKAYFYSITAVNGDGLASDPSARTQVGFPLLSLPDSLRPDNLTGLTRAVLPLNSDPLRDSVPLTLGLEDSSRFSLLYDPAARTASFRARSGKAETGWVVVRAQYFGKFADRESVFVSVAAAKAVPNAIAIGPLRAGAAQGDRFLPTVYSPRSGALTLEKRPGAEGAESLEILALNGSRVLRLRRSGGGTPMRWDGKDGNGAFLRPGRYLWMVRGSSGSSLQGGAILILP